MSAYFAVIHKDEDSGYGVSFPDFPGCVSVGATLDAARSMGAEALALHLEGMVADGEALPMPSSMEVVAASDEARDAIAILLIDAHVLTLEKTA